MRITVLGSAACVPEVGNDSAHYLVNNCLLIDTAWNAAGNLREVLSDYSHLNTLLFTHTHHDHIIGLAGFLFDYRDKHGQLDTLTIYGPEETTETVQRAMDCMQFERFYGKEVGAPTVHILRPGDEITIDDLHICTLGACHPVPALSYRITDDHSSVGFTGDTLLTAEQPAFFAGCDLLFAECSFGLSASDDAKREYGHLDLADAKTIAKDAGHLAIVHLRAETRATLPEDIDRPLKGRVYEL